MSAASMKRTTVVAILDAPKSSVYAQIWKDIDKATSHPEPEVVSHAQNLAATNLIQGKTTCSSMPVESMDDLPISTNADSGLECDLIRICMHDNIGVDDNIGLWVVKSSYASKMPDFIFSIDEVLEDGRIRSCYPCSSMDLLAAQDASLPEDDVNPNFRTPPSSFAYSVLSHRGHEDEVIPTFRGPSNEKHSLPLYFWSHHPLQIHRLGVG